MKRCATPSIIKEILKQWDTTYWFEIGKDYKKGKYPNADKKHRELAHSGTMNVLV